MKEEKDVKKNVVGHMMAERETLAAKLRRGNFLPKLLCLLLAILLWLIVFNVNAVDQMEEAGNGGDAETEWVA